MSGTVFFWPCRRTLRWVDLACDPTSHVTPSFVNYKHNSLPLPPKTFRTCVLVCTYCQNPSFNSCYVSLPLLQLTNCGPGTQNPRNVLELKTVWWRLCDNHKSPNCVNCDLQTHQERTHAVNQASPELAIPLRLVYPRGSATSHPSLQSEWLPRHLVTSDLRMRTA